MLHLARTGANTPGVYRSKLDILHQCSYSPAMKNKGLLVLGGATLVSIVVGHLLWQWRLRKFPETIERGDFERADVLAGELFTGGQLGHDVRILTGLLALCLIARLVTSRFERGPVAKIVGLGYGSYL